MHQAYVIFPACDRLCLKWLASFRAGAGKPHPLDCCKDSYNSDKTGRSVDFLKFTGLER